MQQRSLVGWKTVVYTESEDPEPDSSFDFKFSRHDNIDAPASPHTLLNKIVLIHTRRRHVLSLI
jgi:hypothetical protein